MAQNLQEDSMLIIIKIDMIIFDVGLIGSKIDIFTEFHFIILVIVKVTMTTS